MNGKNKQQSYMVDESVMIIFLLCSSLLLICAATDTMRLGDWIVAENDTLVSAGGKFELGFFSPKEFSSSTSDIRRYVGIWYHNLHRRIVVWVANRKYPLLVNSSVLFGITEDGNLQIRDNRTGESYWSTDLKKSSSSSANRSVTLMDTGNLVLRESINDHWATSSLWESFRDASDTFLPGMKMDENFTLTSWKSEYDPRKGEFHFKLENGSYVVFKSKSVLYWKSGDAGKFFGSAKMSETVVNLLSNFTKNITSHRRNLENDYFLERFVIKPNGMIQYLNWDKENNDWSVKWWEPRDNCSVFNACGDFGICTVSDNGFTCKCIPGFMPKDPRRWKSGDFLGGCKRGKALCSEKTTFLSLKMIKVGYPKSEGLPVNNEAECLKECEDNCHCQAYSLQPAPRRGNTALCWIWQESLNDLQEDYAQGDLELFVQVVLSDLEPTGRDCRPCGTTVVPYPLSTGYDCGDPLYFSFQCSNANGRVSFNASGGEYQVISINPSSQKFIIQVHKDKVIHDCMPKTYRTKNPQLNQSVFNATDWCYDKGKKGKIEVQWKIPQEPTCTLKEDCKEWPSSTCSMAKSDGKKRCLCNSNFNWDGVKLNCTGKQGRDPKQSKEKPYKEKASSPLVILLSTISGVTIMACIVLSFVMWQRKMAERKEKRKLSEQRNRALRPLDTERQINDLIDSSEFKGDGEKGIDLPFFDLESILAATDYFSDENKLGQGGYGPVYKGKFPGGQDIAIKRLSSVSGQGLQEFKNEVILIAKLQHRNLVRLRGYCMEKDEKILLYEYMPNKSLDTFIFDDTKRALLDWVLRFDIIMGIARGLLYLHQDSRLRIIHRDLKTSNILLDQFMNPKISDFGLARMVGGKQTEANTSRVVGTYGYMPPEYALEGVFSVKSDVFSFGVVLLEIVSGKRNTRVVQSDQPLTLQGYAWRLWTENKVLDLMDQTLKESCKEDQFIKCVNVGLLCVQEDPWDRPNMSNIVTMLDSESATLPSPKQPAFVLRRGSSTGTASSSSKPTAITEITFSLEEGR